MIIIVCGKHENLSVGLQETQNPSGLSLSFLLRSLSYISSFYSYYNKCNSLSESSFLYAVW